MTAYDISQQAFIRVWKNLHKWNENTGFRAWFYTIIRNLCFNHQRDTVHKAESELDEARNISKYNTDTDILNDEMKKMVWDALDSLPTDQREIVILIDLREMQYREVAEILEIPIGTVMSRLYYARKKLAQILRPFWKGEL